MNTPSPARLAPSSANQRTSSHTSISVGAPLVSTPTGPSQEDAELASALWRQAVHDLRGKLFVVTNVTTLLQRPATEGNRPELIATLARNVSGLRELLDGVADLARLDAKCEVPVIRTVDIAAVFQEICASVGVLASMRGVRLEYRGPPVLLAESDSVMVSRMAQNLILNAIRHTSASSVMLTYGACEDAAPDAWYFDIRDAEYAVDTGQEFMAVAPAAAQDAAAWPPGEGIGLSIVGRLCHLLGGTMDIESTALGRSTRITMPRRPNLAPDTSTDPAVPPGRSNCTTACAQMGLEPCRPQREPATPISGVQPLLSKRDAEELQEHAPAARPAPDHPMTTPSRHAERHRTDRIGWLRAAVLGANDGIVSTASLLVGVAAAGASHGSLLVTGVAGLIAGAMSMAAGEYVSVHSQADTEQADLAREREELAKAPAAELRELAGIYVAHGLEPALARQVAEQLTAHGALGTHARDELGISDTNTARPVQAALASAASFAAGALLPLAAAALAPDTQVMPWVVGTSIAFLAVLGAVSARTGGAPALTGAWRVCFWGAIAMGITAGAGRMFGAAA